MKEIMVSTYSTVNNMFKLWGWMPSHCISNSKLALLTVASASKSPASLSKTRHWTFALPLLVHFTEVLINNLPLNQIHRRCSFLRHLLKSFMTTLFLPVPLFKNHISQLWSWMPSHRISKPTLLTAASASKSPVPLLKPPIELLLLLQQFTEVLVEVCPFLLLWYFVLYNSIVLLQMVFYLALIAI